MAVNSASGEPIPEHPVLAKLVAQGGSNLRVYSGYVAASNREGYVSIYPSLADLTKRFEILGSDVVQVLDIPESFRPFGAVMVWVRSEADVSAHVVATAARRTAPSTAAVRGGRLRMRLGRFHEPTADCSSDCECESVCDCVSPPCEGPDRPGPRRMM